MEVKLVVKATKYGSRYSRLYEVGNIQRAGGGLDVGSNFAWGYLLRQDGRRVNKRGTTSLIYLPNITEAYFMGVQG